MYLRAVMGLSRQFGPAVLLLASIGAWAPQAVAEPPLIEATSRDFRDSDVRRLTQFPSDLARNFSRLGSRDNLIPLAIGAAAAAAGSAADGRVEGYFHDDSRWQGFDPVGREMGKSQILGPITGALFVAGRFTGDARFRQFTYAMSQGYVMNNIMTAGIKMRTGRERPDQTSTYSFPSGHTANSFMWATVVSRTYGWKAGLPSYAFASYVGASRLKSRKHHVSDIVAGATLGYLIGRTVTRRQRNPERRIRFGMTVPAGGGVALGVGIRP